MAGEEAAHDLAAWAEVQRPRLPGHWCRPGCPVPSGEREPGRSPQSTASGRSSPKVTGSTITGRCCCRHSEDA